MRRTKCGMGDWDGVRTRFSSPPLFVGSPKLYPNIIRTNFAGGKGEVWILLRLAGSGGEGWVFGDDETIGKSPQKQVAAGGEDDKGVGGFERVMGGYFKVGCERT